MTVSHLGNVKNMSPELGQDVPQGLVSEPPQADVDIFTAATRPDNVSSGAPLSEHIASAISGGLGETEKMSQQAMRSMKKASGSGEALDIAAMTRTLSQCSLQTALTTKVVSKTAQAIDKLTNLQ
ncbi:EscI/YscI/HrpB family type III secretion system inner rod protein [Pseudomonas amygdali pv. eriobotryae]|uniref:EscI/YscI/HrpB family type III secretion system inner rod protein n=1 Tax=Pseudomonas amygdali pv. eriobotryae TaxID=129137 RepID=A0A108WIZ0_PSEA0|nr:type III secretion system inner rod subunit SctI [Pseudomonas amygdali]KWS71792.1 type III secretion protein [Pseudomonas amygdali pv. eriobotryae]RML96730.1 Type III secretion component protein HrpB [Pseudomonas amygdali pv. eriobotryae]RMO57534.1 Type III secretion component protein HrpB [Pseudomonas amygdali pv. eriobotryae]GFZ59349.1 EscI/YscI/HrpB family type III secretion system inner rod protein [Pseudomonas amygdali pv. eriobotryae]GFZ72710.1 EscI/YscI/HrpB family type III secretion